MLPPAKFGAFDHFQRQAAAQLSQCCSGQHLKGQTETRLILVTAAWLRFVKLTTLNNDKLIIKHGSKADKVLANYNGQICPGIKHRFQLNV